MRILIILLGLVCASSLPAQVAEICDNGIDDDGDGLIDCEDDDCFFPYFSNGLYGNFNSSDVALGDLDGDGDLDAWVANWKQSGQPRVDQSGGQSGRSCRRTSQTAARNSATPLATMSPSVTSMAMAISMHGSQTQREQPGQPRVGHQGGDGGVGQLRRQRLKHSATPIASESPSVTSMAMAISMHGSQTGATRPTACGSTCGSTALKHSATTIAIVSPYDLGRWRSRCLGRKLRQPEPRVELDWATSQTAGSAAPRSFDVSLGDLDDDGDLDAWVANQPTANPTACGSTRGAIQGGVAGNFADSGQALGNSDSQDVALGDLDGDGDLDAWVANCNDGQPNRVWINQMEEWATSQTAVRLSATPVARCRPR